MRTLLAAMMTVAFCAIATPADAAPDPSVTRSLAGKDWTRLPTKQEVVALTFDAGANADGIPSIMRTLQRTGVPATFFLTGAWVRAYPGYARVIADRGYVLGNHTNTHPHMPTLGDKAFAQQVRTAEKAVTAATGRSTRPFFRFPFGERRIPRDIGRVNALGYAAIGWTVDAAGWLGTSGGQSVASVLQRVKSTSTPGQIVLMHVGSNPQDGTTLDADALPRIIRWLRGHGYAFTDLRFLLDPATAPVVP